MPVTFGAVPHRSRASPVAHSLRVRLAARPLPQILCQSDVLFPQTVNNIKILENYYQVLEIGVKVLFWYY